jgi:hypothetical protein
VKRIPQKIGCVGTLDVDLGLDAEALGDGEYATLIDVLRGHGYEQRKELRRFQLVRQVSTHDGGTPIDVIIDFLMPRDASNGPGQDGSTGGQISQGQRSARK